MQSLPDRHSTHSSGSTRERVGLVVEGIHAAAAVKTIVAAERAGVQQVWMGQVPTEPDTLTTFAAAAMQTNTIRLGTAIIPTYPHHPLALALQVLAFDDLAPGRLRLGIGPSHRPTIEGVYGLEMPSPVAHLREYVHILRALSWEGAINHQGHFYHVAVTLPRATHVPILVSSLREQAFHLAGEAADGALSWVCPIPYLLNTALPALRRGAAQVQRPAPSLVAHVLVALGENRQATLEATRQRIGRYGKLPFYTRMFAEAGFLVAADGTLPDALAESLVISGDEATVAARFKDLLAQGLDELMVLPIFVANQEAELTRLVHLIGQL